MKALTDTVRESMTKQTDELHEEIVNLRNETMATNEVRLTESEKLQKTVLFPLSTSLIIYKHTYSP